MVTRFLFTRHGESTHSTEGVVGGPAGCTGLTPRGQAQARALASRLATLVHGEVSLYSSTLPRAVETATPIAAALRVDARRHCGLCTWHTPADSDGHRMTDFRTTHALPGGGIHRPFDLQVDPASITEWTTGEDPTAWPPPRWTLVRFNDTR